MGKGRGRGRGRGRPPKITITKIGSSIGTRSREIEDDIEQMEVTPTQQLTYSAGASSSRGSTGAAKKLQLSDVLRKEHEVEVEVRRATYSSDGKGSISNNQQGQQKLNLGVLKNTSEEIANNKKEQKTAPVDLPELPESPWTNLFTGNRSAANGLNLKYIPPEIVEGKVKVQLELENQKWRTSLVAYVIGETPGFTYMTRYIAQNWSMVAPPEIFLHAEGYYVIKFQNEHEMYDILYAGPYTINHRPIIMKPWTPECEFSAEYPVDIPLWVTFPKLPMNCWSCDSMSRMGSALGTPMYADECTAKQSRISYARMLVEVNVTKPLVEEVTIIADEGKEFVQPVHYEWRPEFYGKCLKVGHTCDKQLDQTRQPPNREEQFVQPRRRRTARQVQQWQYKGHAVQGDVETQQAKKDELNETLKKDDNATKEQHGQGKNTQANAQNAEPGRNKSPVRKAQVGHVTILNRTASPEQRKSIVKGTEIRSAPVLNLGDFPEPESG